MTACCATSGSIAELPVTKPARASGPN
jgi:hypothetical protein